MQVSQVGCRPAGRGSAATCPCRGSSAEAIEASDPVRSAVYVAWIGCGGIGFSVARDGGQRFSTPIVVPGSQDGASTRSWDPAVAVGPGGVVYVSFMVSGWTVAGAPEADHPVVDVSRDQGATFTELAVLPAANAHSFGDRDFLAVTRSGRILVTWDLAPSIAPVRVRCARAGSCYFTNGDFNAVVQVSAGGGQFTAPAPLGPGYPVNGGVSAPVLVSGGSAAARADVLYLGYAVHGRGEALGRAREYFSSSGDGRSWSRPVQVGVGTPPIAGEWWIDGSIGADSGGNLYATWDTQRPFEVGWLAYSTDGGLRWSKPLRVNQAAPAATDIVQVIGGTPGRAYVAWLTDASPRGYILYLRAFDIRAGWLSPPTRVSKQYGSPLVWPGDTFGMALLSPGTVELSWGGATGLTAGNAGLNSQIVAATVTVAR